MRTSTKTIATELAHVLDQTEQVIGRTLDTAKLKARLAKMDVKDASADLVTMLDNTVERANQLRFRATKEAAQMLKKVSDTCLKMRREILH